MQMIRKVCAAILAVSLMLTVNACGEKQEESSALTAPKKTAAPIKEDDSLFGIYLSNTPVATGNNFVIAEADTVTYRAYFPVVESGTQEYCFYFSNTVDSTYDDGTDANVTMDGGSYTILSASVSDGGKETDAEKSGTQTVTFDGSGERDVTAGETFWSDPVTLTVEEGHYLLWEWTISGTQIPCTNMSNLTSVGADYGDGKGYVYCDQVPLPQLIGCKREHVKYRIAAIGDSITQGCQTDYMAYEFWAAQLSEALGTDYSFWNCGLGWARTSDAATNGDWLQRTGHADIVLVAFGTNDIISGEYGGDGGNTAEEIDAYLQAVLTELKDADCTVIVFNAPPESYPEDLESVRTEYNKQLEETCKEYGAYYFDFACQLSDADAPDIAKYGGHPNGEGGTVVKDAFLEEFAKVLAVDSGK